MEIWLGSTITDALLKKWDTDGYSVSRVKEKSEEILREVTGKSYVFI
jgi:hypothetical protein